MGRLRSMLVAACAVAGLTGAIAPIAFQSAGAAVPPGLPTTEWPSLFGQAFTAVQSFENAGTLTAISTNTTPINSWLTTPQGLVTVNQSSELATDDNGTLLVNVSDLGQQQLVVDVITPGSGDGVALVLDPSTEAVVTTPQVQTTDTPAISTPGGGAATSGNGEDNGNGQGNQNANGQGNDNGDGDGDGHGNGQGQSNGLPSSLPKHLEDIQVLSDGGVQPNVAGGCYSRPTAPVVVGSVFGPLVQGTGIVSCPFSPESISLIAGLYRWGSSAGNAGGGSTYGTSLAVNVFSACNPSGPNPYNTGELFSVNGVLQYGSRSATSWLGCN